VAEQPGRPDKEHGFWMCAALVGGNTSANGIFMLPASLAPYGYSALLGWAVTVVGMSILARVFARLARDFPGADGPYAYIQSTVGDTAAFIAIWCYWMSVWITNAAIAIGLVGYLGTVVPPLASVSPVVTSLALVWLCVAVNLYGVRAGGRVQVLTTALKLVPMAAIIVLGLWLLAVDPHAYAQHAPPATSFSAGSLVAASTLALFAMQGIESATIPAGRVRDPERTIPRATLAGTLLTASIYVAVSTVPLLLIPQQELARSTAPFVDALERITGAGSGRWLAVFVLVSGLGCLNGWTLLVGELTASMAGHGVLPPALRAHNRHGAPARALVLTAMLASAMVLMNYSRSLVQGFTFLTLMVTAAILPLYLFCAVALLVLWRRGHAPPGVDLALLGGFGTAYSVFSFVGVGSEPFLWSLALAMLGLPLYYVLRRRAR